MLKDITIGQYFPGTTPIHKMDPRTKILSVILYIIALFSCKGIVAYALTLVYLIAAVKISKIKLKTILKGVKPVIIIIVFTAILNMFYTQGKNHHAHYGHLPAHLYHLAHYPDRRPGAAAGASEKDSYAGT